MQRNNYVPADRPIGLVLGDEKFAKCGTEILPIDIAVKGSDRAATEREATEFSVRSN